MIPKLESPLYADASFNNLADGHSQGVQIIFLHNSNGW